MNLLLNKVIARLIDNESKAVYNIYPGNISPVFVFCFFVFYVLFMSNSLYVIIKILFSSYGTNVLLFCRYPVASVLNSLTLTQQSGSA